MAFADSTKTQDEAKAAFRRSGLIGMRHDTRIEQRRRLERIFVEKICADELPLDLRERGMIGERIFHLRGARLESLQQVAVTAEEVLQNIGQLTVCCSGSSARTRSTIWLARVLSVGLRSRGSVAGLKGRTMTRVGSGRR